MSTQSSATPGNPPPGSGVKISILFGAVLALVAASIYILQQLKQIRTDIDGMHEAVSRQRSDMEQIRDHLQAEISGERATSEASTEANKSTIEALKRQLDAARRQVNTSVGEAQVAAIKHADELAARIEKMQQDQAQRVNAVSDAVSQVTTDADATKKRVGEVSNEVGTVKNQISATKSDLEKVIEGLRTARGDLDGQSALIATNARELEALKARGERTYTEFALPKEKAPRKFGDVLLRLTAADPKRNRYTVELIADDKRVEKKDKTINEPLQFYLSRSPLPYELVVNEVKKDMISGYVSTPKVQQPRN